MIINDLADVKSDLSGITSVKYLDADGTPAGNGIVAIPASLASKKILSVDITGSNGNGLMAVNCGNFGARILTADGSNNIAVYTLQGTVKLRWVYTD